MIGKTISHYKVLEKIGQGGMGVVYKAEDTTLQRLVALKFLPARLLSQEKEIARFINEARAAASLHHSNICTVYEIGEAEGHTFISMAYVAGQDLLEKIEREPLDIEEAVNMVVQVARGLQAAHDKGIIHRDIKPANIRVDEDNHVTIMDFGLARTAGQTRMTREGTTLGTLAYMSPEQAHGAEVDHRTDIWSLGVCLYEMIAGDVPFRADYDQALIYLILNENAAPPSAVRTGVPIELDRIIEKTMARNQDDRYDTAADLLRDLEVLQASLAAGVPLETGIRVTRVPSIAVLPFTNMSADKEQEYFCDGIAEDIINDLTHVEGLRVIARSSSFVHRDKDKDVREIGRALGVDTLLDGSVRKSGKRVRVTAQLVNVGDGYHMWSERYDRELEDVFAIQDEIAKKIVEALKIELSDEEKRALEKAATKDVEAYDFYLRGLRFFHQSTRNSIEYAREMFSLAMERDPSYALAHAGIADCCSWLFMYFDASPKNLEQAMTASQKAVELDTEAAEVHAARGLAVALSGQYEEAEAEFEVALQLNPKLYETCYFYARTCFVQGKMVKAARWFERACESNPDDYQSSFLLARVYNGQGRSADCERVVRSGLAAAGRHLALNPEDVRAIYLSAQGFVILGDKDKGLEWANRALSVDPKDPTILVNMSAFWGTVGNAEKAAHCLDTAIENGFSQPEWVANDSYFDSVRNHPEFRAALKKFRRNS